MIYDFTFEQVMRLSSIKRWGIIEMSRDQSVAEHSYNVAMIGAAIVGHMGYVPNSVKSQVIEWSLSHDLTELVSGDIPTPMKSYLGSTIEDMERGMFPKFMEHKDGVSDLVYGIVKAADFIDAIQFARKFCVDSRKEEIIEEMLLKLESHIKGLEEKSNLPVASAVEKVWTDVKTPLKRT